MEPKEIENIINRMMARREAVIPEGSKLLRREESSMVPPLVVEKDLSNIVEYNGKQYIKRITYIREYKVIEEYYELPEGSEDAEE